MVERYECLWKDFIQNNTPSPSQKLAKDLNSKAALPAHVCPLGAAGG